MDVKFTIPNPLPALSYTFPVTGGFIGLIGGALLFRYFVKEEKSELRETIPSSLAGDVLEAWTNFFFDGIGYCFSALPYLLGGSFGGVMIGIIADKFLTKRIGS